MKFVQTNKNKGGSVNNFLNGRRIHTAVLPEPATKGGYIQWDNDGKGWVSLEDHNKVVNRLMRAMTSKGENGKDQD